jgi:hypothetical protein
MATDKKVKYDMQGGVKNYLGKQKTVKAPLHWRSGPKHPSTELAYITKKEKDLLIKKDLHRSLKGGVNRGPSGIMSLNGWGSTDSGQNVSGTAASAAETGSRNARDRAEVRAQFTGSGPALPPGVTPQGALDFRAAAINAGAGQRVNPGFFDSRTRLSPNAIALAKAYRNDPNNRFAKQAYRNTGQGGLRGFLTSGGIFGNLIRGVGQKFGWGKKYNEPTYDMSQFSNYGLGGIPPGTLDEDEDEKISDVSFSPRASVDFGDTVAPKPIDNWSTEGQGYPLRNDFNYTGDTNWFSGMDEPPIGNKDGGRIGYQGGELVDEDINVQGPGFDFNENIEMAEGPSPFEMRINELMDEGLSWQEAYNIAAQEFGMAQGEDESFSEEGIASVV